ncbi:hypothetical protein [Sedimentitalea sp.]
MPRLNGGTLSSQAVCGYDSSELIPRDRDVQENTEQSQSRKAWRAQPRLSNSEQPTLMARNSNRDNFTPKTKLQIAKRSGWICSDPECMRPTVGATSDGDGEIMLGEASHICAAAPGGPRYDAGMSEAERRSAKNGIWMCKLHAKSVDSDDAKFTVELLRCWKKQAEEHSHRNVLYNDATRPARISTNDLANRLHVSAAADVDIFRRFERWPSTDVALTVQMRELDKPVQTSALARALSEFGDLVLVAPPGMGKTSTLLQVAEGLVAHGETPIFVPLADWGTENKRLLDYILGRATFRGEITEDDFRAVAQEPGVYLLLDGWNELDGAARRRATVELKRLQADLPELGLLVSTRKQSLDVPFEGATVELLPLGEAEQMEIARVLRGDDGARIVDQAWRTSGIRELVSIPLYLTALLSLPDGQPFPKTKEEILRRFVKAHEQQADHAEPLQEAVKGLQTEFLSALAVTATRAANTSIPETNSRRSVAQTDNWLVEDGQITIKLQTTDVLDALVSHHVLVRTGEPAGYSFQHQQFQEWYASNDVERAMLKSVDDADALQKLKTDILNATLWEEAILFAVERMARGDEPQQRACSVAIIAALEVDLVLAAEMIFCATDVVWAQVSEPIQKLVLRWHAPGKLDRAVRFMITSGRPEFRDLVWPLITSENNQKSLPALRAARRFRASVLGPDAAKDILALPNKVRETVVSEIAYSSGIDGLDLVALIAKSCPDPELKAAAVDGMSFRRADRHVADVLSTANDDTFDLVYRNGHLEEIDDKVIQQQLAMARSRAEKGVSVYERLRAIVYGRDGKDHSAELTELIATIEIQRKQDAEVGLIYEACKQFRQAVALGLLKRLREERELFFGADNILASSCIVVEDEALLEMVLSPQERMDSRAEAAASVLGPVSVGKLIDTKVAVFAEIKKLGGYQKSLSDRYYGLRDRIAHAPGASLVVAVQERAAAANNEEIRELAELLCRRDEEGDRARPFPQDADAAVSQMMEQWGERLIASDDTATRSQLSAVADLIGHFPSVALLPMLKRLLDDELRRYRAFRKQAEEERWRQGEATNEARMLYTNRYQHAFTKIKAPETTTLMISYLSDEHFGETAALVLKVQWILANEPKDDHRFRGSVDFSRVKEMRAVRTRCATLTCNEADAIFEAIAPLISEGATDAQKKHAVALAIQAVRLPHGVRADTINALLSIAPQVARAKLVLNLILSGETIPFSVVQTGIYDVFEDAKKHAWILDEGWQLKAWLLLLPFTDHPVQLVDTIAALPIRQREPYFLEGMIRACETVRAPEIEEALFMLAKNDAVFYDNHAWRDAVRRQGTLTSARRYLDLFIEGKIDGRDGWRASQEVADLLKTYSELRDYAFGLLKDGNSPKALLLANAVAEGDDPDGLLQLVELENRLRRSLISRRAIEGVVTEHVPSEHWRGAFDVLPIAATELRRKLLAMTTDGGPHDAAARALREIERVRDKDGAPEDEPRHPDLASGKPWPILVADPEAEGG